MHLSLPILVLLSTLCTASPAPNPAVIARAKTTTCSAVRATPSPKNTICGAYCQLNEPSEIYFSGAGDASGPDYPASCAQQCLQHAQCISFTYEAHEGYCGFFNKTIENQGFVSSTSTDLSCYDRKCYVKKCA